MKKFVIVYMLLIAIPVAGMAATDQAIGSSTATHIDQSHPGSTMTAKEQFGTKHLSAAAAHEQAAIHHKAAADAQTMQAREEHTKAAEKASVTACKKSKETLKSSTSK